MHGRGMQRREFVQGRESGTFDDPHQTPGGYGAERGVWGGFSFRRRDLEGGNYVVRDALCDDGAAEVSGEGWHDLVGGGGDDGDGRAGVARWVRLCDAQRECGGAAAADRVQHGGGPFAGSGGNAYD